MLDKKTILTRLLPTIEISGEVDLARAIALYVASPTNKHMAEIMCEAAESGDWYDVLDELLNWN